MGLFLRPAPKHARCGSHRVVPAAETIRRVWPLARRLGVTRLADITGLDRLGIPTYSATVPRSRDILSVYNGKGANRLEAQAGALMEAIERQAALRSDVERIQASPASLAGRELFLDPRGVNVDLASDYDEQRTYAWIWGHDLLRDEPILVPASLAAYLSGPAHGPTCFATSSSHGLASGNTLEEAVCQALCEIFERDTATMAELGAHYVPLVRREVALGSAFREGPDDFERWPCLALDDAPAPVPRLAAAFQGAGLTPIVRDITGDAGVPTVMATVADETVYGHPMAHLGYGTHPNAAVAVCRALAEAAQSRVVDIHAVREDILERDTPLGPRAARHTRRVSAVNRRSWFHAPGQRRRAFSDMLSRTHGDVLEDIHWLLDRARLAGFDRVIVVDLAPRLQEARVVRVIVPNAETWGVDQSKLGPRATAWWRRHV